MRKNLILSVTLLLLFGCIYLLTHLANDNKPTENIRNNFQTNNRMNSTENIDDANTSEDVDDNVNNQASKIDEDNNNQVKLDVSNLMDDSPSQEMVISSHLQKIQLPDAIYDDIDTPYNDIIYTPRNSMFRGMYIMKDSYLFSEPKIESQLVSIVRQGVAVNVVESIDEWSFVKILFLERSNYESFYGWIPNSKLCYIEDFDSIVGIDVLIKESHEPESAQSFINGLWGSIQNETTNQFGLSINGTEYLEIDKQNIEAFFRKRDKIDTASNINDNPDQGKVIPSSLQTILLPESLFDDPATPYNDIIFTPRNLKYKGMYVMNDSYLFSEPNSESQWISVVWKGSAVNVVVSTGEWSFVKILFLERAHYESFYGWIPTSYLGYIEDFDSLEGIDVLIKEGHEPESAQSFNNGLWGTIYNEKDSQYSLRSYGASEIIIDKKYVEPFYSKKK